MKSRKPACRNTSERHVHENHYDRRALPEIAAAELERAVQKPGLKSAMIGGRTNGLFLDDPLFQLILEAAAALEVPIYLHPSYPPKVVQDAYYAGLDPAVSARFATA